MVGARPVRRSVYAKTKAEAAHKLRAEIAARDAGISGDAGRGTLAAFLTAWLASVRPTMKPSSWHRYEDAVRLHLIPSLGNLPVGHVTPAAIQRTYARLLADGLAPATVRRIHAALHRALRHGVSWRLIASNPAADAEPPRVPRREMTALTADQARALLDTAHEDALAALWTLAITSGMRQGELLALRWTDIDTAGGAAQVIRTVQWIPGAGYRESEPKTTRSRRRVALTDTALAALARHSRSQASARLQAGPLWTDHGLVFATATGDHLSKAAVTRRFHNVCRDAGVPKVRFHDMRHTAASLLMSRGVHPKVVSEMLGHSTIAVTLDLYSHVTPTMQRDATHAMDALIGIP